MTLWALKVTVSLLLLVEASPTCCLLESAQENNRQLQDYTVPELIATLSDCASNPGQVPADYLKVVEVARESEDKAAIRLLKDTAEAYGRAGRRSACFHALKQYSLAVTPYPSQYLLDGVGKFRGERFFAEAALALLASHPELELFEEAHARLAEVSKGGVLREHRDLRQLLQMAKATSQYYSRFRSFEDNSHQAAFLMSFSLFVPDGSRRNEDLDAPDQAWARRAFFELSERAPEMVAGKLCEYVVRAGIGAAEPKLDLVYGAVSVSAMDKLKSMLIQ